MTLSHLPRAEQSARGHRSGSSPRCRHHAEPSQTRGYLSTHWPTTKNVAFMLYLFNMSISSCVSSLPPGRVKMTERPFYRRAAHSRSEAVCRLRQRPTTVGLLVVQNITAVSTTRATADAAAFRFFILPNNFSEKIPPVKALYITMPVRRV